MEPFIQLNYAEQCHRKPSTPKETPFVDNTKVPELFWIDLLEKKCVEGLGEVSEHLANDENLMPDDFLGDQLLSPLNSGLEGSGENCCRSRKSADYQRFKTPLALKCVHKSVGTPCLFSQDESVNTTPISGQQCNEHARTQSSPTCVGDTQFVHESPSTFQVLYTPAALSRHRSVGGLSEKSTKTPNLLADIMGQGRTSLSCLLAESEDQEIAEWTESMATPPLKITRSAADETGENEEAEGNVEEDEECQPSTKRIVRVLFSGSSTNQSWEPLELSSDGVVTSKQSLNLSNGEDANGETEHRAETRNDTSIHEEFLVEYSCYSDSKYPHQDVPESAYEVTLVASPSVNTCGRSKSSYCGENVISTPLVNTCKPQYLEQSPNPKLLDSQCPGDVLSPSCGVPLRALAQSTPKPSIQGSARFGSWQNGLAVEEPDASLCGRHVLTDSPSRSCEKTVVRALCDVTSHTEANCKLDSSRVIFGSPSRSFELAMAHETDKLSSGEEQGSSLSSCSQSPRSEDVLNTTARSQSTKASRETSYKATRQSTEGGQSNQLTEITTTAITLNQATITTQGNPIIQTSRSETKTWSPSNPANEISSGLVNGHDSHIRRKSFCKPPGLRRSAGTKRFLYPAASQVSKEDTGKRFREENTNNSSWCEEEKAPLTNGNGVTACETNRDDKTACNMTCDQSGENEVHVAKKLRVDEKKQGCCREKQVNGAEKDDVLFDMDTLSQFPVDCIMSQPASICDSDSLYVATSPPMEQHQLNVTYTITKDETRGIGETIDPVTTSVEDEARVSFNGKIMKKSEKEEGEDEAGSEDLLTINCRASVTFSATTETESNDPSSSYLVKSKDKKVVDLSNPSTFGPVDSDGIIPEFVGFHTANGRRVSVSLEALAKAKATMEEVDSLLSLNNRLNEDPAEKSKSEVPSAPSEVGTSCKPTAISNMDVNHSSSKILYFEVQKVPAFCGFSTASGKQVCVTEAALKQAKKTLSELDVELKIKSSEQYFEATTVDGEPLGRVSALESEVGSVSDFQEVPHVSSGENVTTSVDEMKKIRDCRADILNRCEIECKRFEFSSRPDHSNRNLFQAYTPSGVHTNSLRTTADEDSVIETKNVENVNDSLLEDLLNDCKKKRRHSMETISEEKERNMEKISDSSRTERNFELNDLLSITDYREGLDHWENITAEPCPDVASRDKGKPNSFPGSKSALRESENIANKIDDERTISEEQITDRESVNGIDIAIVVKDLESSLIVGKRNEHQVEAGDLVDGKNKPLEFRTATGKAVEISEDSLEAAKSTIKKINDEVLSEWQKDSKDDSSSSCDFESAFKETEKRCEERSQTLKETIKKANENVSNESDLKRGVVSFSGFHTAGGKKISLSEEALKAGREIMKRLSEDASEDCLGRRNETSPLLCTTGRCRLVGAENPSVYEHSPECELTRCANRSLSNTVRVNREVHTGAYPSTEYPSEAADDDHARKTDTSGKRSLLKGAMNLQQIDESLEQSENKTGPNNGFSGFQTAVGNIVKLSKESLENGAAIMRQIDSSVEDSFRKTRPSAADMSGFCDIQTASERSVYPSPDSSVKGTAILHPMDASEGKSKKTLASNTAKPPRFAGFQIAAGKNVGIRKETLEKGAAIMQQIDRSLVEGKDENLSGSRSGIIFQTAEGRSVPISNESLNKGAAITQQTDKSPEEAFSGFRTANGQSVQLSTASLEKGAAIMRQIDRSLEDGKGNSMSTLPSEKGFAGFRTGNGQSVQLSTASLEKRAAIMRQIDKSLEDGKENSMSTLPSEKGFAGFRTGNGQSVQLSTASLEKGAAKMRQIDRSLEDGKENSMSTLPSEKGFAGFRTGNGQSVQLSTASLEKGAAKMRQIDRSLEDGKENSMSTLPSEKGFAGFRTGNGQSVQLSTASLEKGAAIMRQIDRSLEDGKENSMSTLPSEKGFAGFRTGNGQSVQLSTASLEKGAAIMRQIDRSLEDGKENSMSTLPSEKGFAGFRTGNGQSVQLSTASLEKGAAIMRQIDRSLEDGKENSMSTLPSEKGFAGFRTGNGQSVQLSTASLEKRAAIMRQIDRSLEDGKENSMSTLPSEKGFAGFRTGNGQSVQLSTASLEKGAAIMRQIDRSLGEGKGNGTPISPSATGFSGFRTANGKSVQLSKESLEKGAALMRQIDRSFEEGMAKILSASSRKTGFSGFRTANGQSVKLSKESLEKGAAIIQQIDESLEESMGNNAGHDTRCMAGGTSFQTARGQSAILSKELPEKVRATMQQIDKSLKEMNDNSVSCSRSATTFSGFQTASGHSVKLSKTSLEKGAKIMQEIDKSLEVKVDSGDSRTSNCIALSGFQTGAGKTAQISESALAKAKETIVGIQRELCLVSPRSGGLGCEIVAEVKNTHAGSNTIRQRSTVENTDNSSALVVNNTDDANFKGFFTAGGQRVSVSEDALAKASKFIQETNTDLSNSKTEQGTDASLHECTVAPVSAEAHDKSARTTERNLSLEHDEVVSREILESSEALLADETIMEVAEYLHDKEERSAVGLKSRDRLRPGGPLLERKKGISATEAASGSKPDFSRRHSAPLQCSEDVVRANNQAVTRNGLKPQIVTPSGILNDRRSRSFHVPLRARYSSYENIRSSGSSRRYNDTDTDLKTSSKSSDCNRYLRPLQSLSPACFKSKTVPLPRTSTPVHSATNRRASGPRFQFITPYRKHQATKDTSPLVRCSSTSGVTADDLLEDRVSAVNEPSPKKPRLSVVKGVLYTVGSDFGNASKAECKTRPQPGFLSQVRHCNQRIKLREFVGNSTPGGFGAAELIALGVSPDLLSVTPSNAKSFRFDGKSYFSGAFMSSKEGVRTEDGGLLHVGTDGCVGLEEIQSAFLSTPGVDKELINEEWIANHYRWIIWKLAAMEVAFPRLFAGRYLTPDWALCQLKYRYDREIDNSHRSALKKILERDDVSSRTMVLCVSSVSVSDKEPGGVAQEKKDQDGENDTQVVAKKTEPMCAVIELTDGWYSIRGLLDRPLTRLLNDRKLGVGQKLCINGAELVGSDQAVSPLEAPSSLMLRLTANSTRRARWDAKLGFHRYTRAFPLPLTSLFGDGGFTGCVDVIVLRQYPVQWMEKMPDGTNVFRNSRLEEREAKRFEVDRHQGREKLFLKIQEDFEKEFRQPELERRRSVRLRRRPVSPCDLKELHDGKEIYEALTQASDPDAVKEYLDESQVRALEDYRRLLQERKCAELQSKFERLWKEQEAESQLQRNVVPLLKVRITDYFLKGQAKQNAMLSIWRPSEEVMQLLSEGFRLRIYHLTAGGVRFRQGASELQLSATRTTRYELLPSEPDVLRPSYMPRQVCCFDELRCSSTQQFSEVDIVGLVVFCSPLSCFSTSSSSVQTVYLSDEKSNLVATKFWGGLKAIAVEDLVKPRSFICCSNLSVRPDDRLQCPSLTFSELSSLTLKPRELHLRTALDKLQQNIPDLDLFMARIQNTLTSFLRPHRPSSSTKIKLNTVRMYGNSTFATPSDWMQKHDSSKTLNTEELGDEENNSSFNDEEGRPAGVVQSVVSDRDSESTQKPLVPSCEGQTTLAMTRALSRQAKRKLLDSIAEPPPLSPLPSPIPVSVRREFKRPRRVGSPANLPLEQ